MSEVKNELDQKLAAAREQLHTTLEERKVAEAAREEAASLLRARELALEDVLEEEGRLRGAIGQLEQMRDAVDKSEEGV